MARYAIRGELAQNWKDEWIWTYFIHDKESQRRYRCANWRASFKLLETFIAIDKGKMDMPEGVERNGRRMEITTKRCTESMD
jgi:hypothetical protein